MSDQFKGERCTCWCGAEGELPPRRDRNQSAVLRVTHEGGLVHKMLAVRFDDEAGVRFRHVEANDEDE